MRAPRGATTGLTTSHASTPSSSPASREDSRVKAGSAGPASTLRGHSSRPTDCRRSTWSGQCLGCRIATRASAHRRDEQASAIRLPRSRPLLGEAGAEGTVYNRAILTGRAYARNSQGALIEALTVNPGESAMTIAVTGATGQLGRLVIDKLKAKAGEAIVALVRSPANARGLGVAVREADYAQPATLKSALAGVDVLLFISSSEIRERAAQHHNVIEAAKAAEVKRIVYTSLLHADVSPMSLGVEHRATEVELKAAGIPQTILRNGWYTENHPASIGGALAGG